MRRMRRRRRRMPKQKLGKKPRHVRKQKLRTTRAMWSWRSRPDASDW
jgi:hypothetical protein